MHLLLRLTIRNMGVLQQFHINFRKEIMNWGKKKEKSAFPLSLELIIYFLNNAKRSVSVIRDGCAWVVDDKEAVHNPTLMKSIGINVCNSSVYAENSQQSTALSSNVFGEIILTQRKIQYPGSERIFQHHCPQDTIVPPVFCVFVSSSRNLAVTLTPGCCLHYNRQHPAVPAEN